MTSLIPVMVTPPVADPVTLPAAKLHCRVDHDDDDSVVTALIASAVAYLDGWRGVLGRAIMAQTWKAYAPCAGTYVLPMPDVTAASVIYDGETEADSLVVEIASGGPQVEVSGAGWITFAAEMPAFLLPAARTAILMLVGHWYANREAASANLDEVPLAASALIASLRWRHV